MDEVSSFRVIILEQMYTLPQKNNLGPSLGGHGITWMCNL